MKKQKTLEKFKLEPKKEKDICEICGKEVKELSSIRINTWDTSRRYVTSQRPVVNNYKMRMCQQCFNIIMTTFTMKIDRLSK